MELYSATEKNKLQLAWANHATRLAEWTLEVLACRQDTYGHYYLKDGAILNGRALKWPSKEPLPLTLRVLREHWSGTRTIGLYACSADDQVKTLSFDFDNHDDDLDKRHLNHGEWRLLVKRLADLGMQAVAYNSDGKGGFHVHVPFTRKIAVGQAMSFGAWLARDLKAELEVFPKGAVSHTEKQCGNYIRLVLPKPGRTVYPAIYTGLKTLWDVDEIVAYLLDVRGNEPDLIPPEALTYSPPPREPKPIKRQDGSTVQPEDWYEFCATVSGDLRQLDWPGLFEKFKMLDRPDGEKWLVTCPWAAEHSTGNAGTAIWQAQDGYPGFNCLHDHCTGRTWKDALQWFGASEVSEHCAGMYCDRGVQDDVSKYYNKKTKVDVKEIAHNPPDLQDAQEGPPEAPGGMAEAKGDQEPAEPESRRRGYTLTDLEALPKPRWLVRNQIQSGTLVQVFGEPGAYKTFWALDVCLSVASGAKALATFPTMKSPTLYCLAEGCGGVQYRIKAWMRRSGLPFPEDFRVVPFRFNLLDELELRAIYTIIEKDLKQVPGLITIDTVARNMQGDENSPKDMSSFIANITKLQECTGAAVMVVHHSGWNPDRERGHSSLRGACDTIIQIKKSKTPLVQCFKQKDADPFDDYLITSQSFQFGTDEDGVAITSLALSVSSGSFQKVQLLQPGKKEDMYKLFHAFGRNTFAQSDCLTVLGKHKGTISRDFKELTQAGVLEKKDGQYAIPYDVLVELSTRNPD